MTNCTPNGLPVAAATAAWMTGAACTGTGAGVLEGAADGSAAAVALADGERRFCDCFCRLLALRRGFR